MCTVASITATFMLLLALTMTMSLVDACGSSRLPRSASEALYDDASTAATRQHVFRGTVIRDLSPLSPLHETDASSSHTPDGQSPIAHYIVQINRVYKGCSLKATDRILVSSGGVCGTRLTLDTTYVFTTSRLQSMDAAQWAMLGNRSKVKQVLFTSAETAILDWNEVDDNDKSVYNAYRKSCP